MLPTPNIHQILEGARAVVEFCNDQTDWVWGLMWHEYPALMAALTVVSALKTARWLWRSLTSA